MKYCGGGIGRRLKVESKLPCRFREVGLTMRGDRNSNPRPQYNIK